MWRYPLGELIMWQNIRFGNLVYLVQQHPGECLVGLAATVAAIFGVMAFINPWCWVSGKPNGACEFEISILWTHYDGKGAALQLAGTGIVYSLLVLMLGLSGIYDTARNRIGETKIRAAAVGTAIGYLIVLGGLYADLADQNKDATDSLALVFSILMSISGWVFILSAQPVLWRWVGSMLRSIAAIVVQRTISILAKLVSVFR